MYVREVGGERLTDKVADEVECSILLSTRPVVESGDRLQVATLQDAQHSVLPWVNLEVAPYVA